MIDLVREKMVGAIKLEDDETYDSVIDDYFNHHNHREWVLPDNEGFLCVTEYDEYCVVNFAWHIGKRRTAKAMVLLGRDIYKHYTVDKNKPLYYSGSTNLYSNHSISVGDGVWQFVV